MELTTRMPTDSTLAVKPEWLIMTDGTRVTLDYFAQESCETSYPSCFGHTAERKPLNPAVKSATPLEAAGIKYEPTETKAKLSVPASTTELRVEPPTYWHNNGDGIFVAKGKRPDRASRERSTSTSFPAEQQHHVSAQSANAKKAVGPFDQVPSRPEASTSRLDQVHGSSETLVDPLVLGWGMPGFKSKNRAIKSGHHALTINTGINIVEPHFGAMDFSNSPDSVANGFLILGSNSVYGISSDSHLSAVNKCGRRKINAGVSTDKTLAVSPDSLSVCETPNRGNAGKS
jgi:hypothetical protein